MAGTWSGRKERALNRTTAQSTELRRNGIAALILQVQGSSHIDAHTWLVSHVVRNEPKRRAESLSERVTG